MKYFPWIRFLASFSFLLFTIYIRTDYKASVDKDTYKYVALIVLSFAFFIYYKYQISGFRFIIL